ncbi:ATP-binding protein, partial [Yersinia enterocolitica]|nr:ATP-binding protein [Yersinia enterocolitica]
TDEPELSLHIAWQKNIIPAIKELNPNAQIIAATHSPEVASNYKNSIFDMETLVHG